MAKLSQHQSVRIFISSTFKDMHSERDHLVKYVFPELAERCKRKGLNLVPIDLRWGVTEDEARDGKVIEICLDEIESSRPFFIGIVGERYGWTPDEYETSDYPRYDWLKSFEKGHSITALEIYHGVLNNADMHPRAFFYFRDPSFLNDVPVEKQPDMQVENPESAQKLFELKNQIRNIYATKKLQGHFTESYPSKYKGIRINWPQVKADLGETLSESNLKAIEAVTGDDNLVDKHKYEKLNSDQLSIVNKYGAVYLDGLEELGKDILEDLWQAIEQEFPYSEKETNPLVIERNEHEYFLLYKTRRFIGRKELLRELFSTIEATKAKPLFIFGEPGSGKSAIMAMIVKWHREKHPNGYTVARFVGASPASSNILSLVRNIIEDLAANNGIAVDEERISNSQLINQYFFEILYKVASSEKMLLIAIDGLNQLHPMHDPHFLTWLPKRFPENVLMVVSSLDGDFIASAKRFEMPVYTVKALSREDRKDIVSSILAEYRKGLSEKQMHLLLEKADSDKPLYLAVTCEELRIYPVFEQITARIENFQDSTSSVFEQVIERLEQDYGRRIVQDALCLVECSMYGLLENELLTLLRREEDEMLPANIWARLHRGISHYMSNAGDKREGLLTFFHQQFSIAVRARYLAKPEIENHYNRHMAAYGMAEFEKMPGVVGNCLKYSGIYLYKTKNSETLTRLLADIFKEENHNASQESIAEELFSYVVTTLKADKEVILKSIMEILVRKHITHRLASFFNHQGNRYKNIGYSTWALEFFEKSMKAREDLVAIEPGRTDLRKDLSVSLNEVGNMYKALGQETMALECFEKDLKLMEELVALEPGRSDFCRELSGSYNDTGKMYKAMGQGAKALEFLEKSMVLMEELVALEPGRTDFRRDLSVSINDVGIMYKSMGQGTKALELHVKSMKIREELVVIEPGRTDFRRDLSMSFHYVGNTYKEMKQKPKALKFYEESMRVREELVAIEPDRTDLRRDLSVSFNDVGSIYRSLGQEMKALEFFEKSLKVIEELVAIEPDRTDFQSSFTNSLNDVGSIYRSLGQEMKALEFFEKSLKVIEELVAIEPGRTDFQSSFTNSLNNVGNIYSDMGQKIKALEFHEKSLKVMEELVALEPSRTDYKVEHAIIHYNIYLVCPNDDKLKWLTKAKTILQAMIEQDIVHRQLELVWKMINKAIEENQNQ